VTTSGLATIAVLALVALIASAVVAASLRAIAIAPGSPCIVDVVVWGGLAITPVETAIVRGELATVHQVAIVIGDAPAVASRASVVVVVAGGLAITPRLCVDVIV